MTVKLFRCLQVSFKARCSAVEKSAASLVIHDDLEEKAPVAVFSSYSGAKDSFELYLNVFFFSLALSMECIYQNISMV